MQQLAHFPIHLFPCTFVNGVSGSSAAHAKTLHLPRQPITLVSASEVVDHNQDVVRGQFLTADYVHTDVFLFRTSQGWESLQQCLGFSTKAVLWSILH